MRASTLRPVLLEVLGVAGSGKSTVVSRLVGGDPFSRAPFISAREPAHIVQIASALPEVAPLVFANFLRRPRMTWADFKLIVYVTRWRRLLEASRYSNRILVLDQGPLYALVRLRAKGLGLTSTKGFDQWWRDQLADWAHSMGTVVWLDAPDDVLVSRINERDQSHWVKGEAPEVGLAFIQRYRDLFLEVIEEVDQIGGGPAIHRFDTDAMTADEISEQVRRALVR